MFDDQDAGPYLTTSQAAERLRVKLQTLEQWRREGVGPPFRKHGRRVVYHINDLDAWSESQRRTRADRYSKPSTDSSDQPD